MGAGTPIGEALRAGDCRRDQLRPETADATSRSLTRLGIVTAVDLKLLVVPGGQEAEELMVELKAGGLSLGARAKIRLLVGRARAGDQHAPIARASSIGDIGRQPNDHNNDDGAAPRQRRSLHDLASDDMSMDTISIVLTVLIGAAGFFVQAHSARQAGKNTTFKKLL